MEKRNGKIKKYKTTRGNLNTFVSVDGKTVRVRFISRDNKEGYFMTSDCSLQTALENDRDYGTKYTLSDEMPESIGETPVEYNEIASVTTWQQAKEFLHAAPYGVPLRSLTTPEKIKKAAQTCGLTFPCIKE